MLRHKDEKNIREIYGKAYLGTWGNFEDYLDDDVICYLLFAYNPIHTSPIIAFEEDKKYYYFETFNTIYKVKKENLMQPSYKDVLKEFKDYLNSEEFKILEKNYPNRV